ncbi:MAG: HU family DNA-binding protein [Thiohalocapsa sp.]
MNRTDLASAISSNLDIAETQALKFIDSFEQIVRTTLSEGGEVCLIGFGRFHRKKHRARIGRNPHTGETIALPARYVPAFSPGKTLKETLKETA